MKPATHLLPLLLLGLASCGSQSADKKLVTTKATYASPPLDSIKSAVVAYVKKDLKQPASYQPARWGKARAWQQRDADSISAEIAQAEARLFLTMLERDRNRLRNADISPAHAAQFQTHLRELENQVRLLERKRDSLVQSTDTTRLGSLIYHAYWTKNKRGVPALDSGQFIVSEHGTVSQLGKIPDLDKMTYSPTIQHSSFAGQHLR